MGTSRIILLGPPGAGKGTQARLLEEHFGLVHISSGDLLRDAVARETENGLKAQDYMNRGQLVPDGLVLELIRERLQAVGDGFLLDGFPRNLAQAETLERMLEAIGRPLQCAISLEVPTEELVQRISGRRVCRCCGNMHHAHFDPPPRPGHCGKCDGELVQREDDREETVRARLGVFDRETRPLLEFYRRREILREVDGTGTPAAVFERIIHQVDGCP